MIIVTGQLTGDAADYERLLALALDLMRESAQEPGCIAYRVTQDLQNRLRLWVFEVWQSETALTAHLQSPHFASFQKLLTEVALHDSAFSRYRAQEG
ncbi:MAG: antibiotic biosynthesis monooxygenase [Polyangiaceae bacterium]|jgi:quinol monooxygenase YgiN|nr:antibiotic biosynthesis monooxygenase [Polyangiaceae bacterium]